MDWERREGEVGTRDEEGSVRRGEREAGEAGNAEGEGGERGSVDHDVGERWRQGKRVPPRTAAAPAPGGEPSSSPKRRG